VVALLILPAHAACFVRVARQKPHVTVAWPAFRSFALSGAAGVGSVLALVVIGANQLSHQIGRQGHLDELVRGWDRLVAGSTLGALVLGAVVLALALGAAFSAHQPPMLGLWIIVPPVVLLSLYSVLHLWAIRYLLFTLPALVILVANAIDHYAERWRLRAWATPAAVLAILVFGFGMHLKTRSSLARISADYRPMAEDLRKLAAPGDAVAFAGKKIIPRIPRLALRYELRQGPFLNDVFMSKAMEEMGLFVPEECKDPRPCLPDRVKRVWLVTSGPSTKLFEGMPKARAQLLKEEFVVSELHPHWNANLALLTRKTN
jgi:mannosyltransferase